MRKQYFDIGVETTSECVALLHLYKKAKWKRIAKFNIKIDADETHVVRTFTDGTETVSLISTDSETILCLCDLYKLKGIIEQIQKYAKKVYTHDYGDVYLNPWDMKVWIVGGDGGIFYSDKSPKEIAKDLEEQGFDGIEGDVDFDHIEGIKETLVEAECSPDDDEEDDYILVGKANDVGNFEEF
jgi:hypothetical protein